MIIRWQRTAGPLTATGNQPSVPWQVTPTGAALPDYPDLLSALVGYLSQAATVIAALPDGSGGQRVYTDIAMAPTTYPVVIISDYQEEDPGETLDDKMISLTVICFSADTPTASGLDLVRTLSTTMRQAIDSPAINSNGLRVWRLAWIDGFESGVVRYPSRPVRLPGQRSGSFVWREDISWEFWCQPREEA